jgi:hypothetical protein
VGALHANVIPVDFQTRRRLGVGGAVPVSRPRQLQIGTARDVLARAPVFVMFCRPAPRGAGGDYLGGRWDDWGWTMFVWTSDAAVGAAWTDLVDRRGYVPERLTRDAFLLFLRRASDLGGLLIDGEFDDGGIVINAEVDQLVRRDDALALLRR